MRFTRSSSDRLFAAETLVETADVGAKEVVEGGGGRGRGTARATSRFGRGMQRSGRLLRKRFFIGEGGD